MSLLLVSKRAEHPFAWEKLNIRVYCAEELACCIFRYPLLALDGLIGEPLFDWFRRELGAFELASELESQRKAGESMENLLLEILQAANYYTLAELKEFRSRLVGLKKMSASARLEETGRTFFQAGRFHLAEEAYQSALRELEREQLRVRGEDEAVKCKEEKADVYCNLAAVCMRNFDEAGALENIELARKTAYRKRTEEYRFFICGQADLSQAEIAELEEKKAAAGKKADESSLVSGIRTLEALDHTDCMQLASKILKEWKKEYRKA